MPMKRYRVIFNGNISSGNNVETVKKRLASFFKGDKKKIERLFSGQPILIKKDTDFQTATKYMNTFKKAGAICTIEAIGISTSPGLLGTRSDNKSSALKRNEFMTCPKCGYRQKHSSECVACGIVIKKYLEKSIEEPKDSDPPGRQGSMEFRSDRSKTVLIGVVTGFIGICCLVMFALSAAYHKTAWPLILVGVFLIPVSIAVITYSSFATIDAQKKLVEKTIRTLFWKKTWIFSVSDFSGVGISTASGGSPQGRPKILYFIQMIGLKNLSIPGYYYNKDKALTEARNISKFLNLPLDEEAKIGFFGKRL